MILSGVNFRGYEKLRKLDDLIWPLTWPLFQSVPCGSKMNFRLIMTVSYVKSLWKTHFYDLNKWQILLTVQNLTKSFLYRIWTWKNEIHRRIVENGSINSEHELGTMIHSMKVNGPKLDAFPDAELLTVIPDSLAYIFEWYSLYNQSLKVMGSIIHRETIWTSKMLTLLKLKG